MHVPSANFDWRKPSVTPRMVRNWLHGAAKQSDVAREISLVLFLARRAAGLQNRRLAELAGLQPTVISRIETGRSDPQWSTIYRIIDALDLELSLYPRSLRVVPVPMQDLVGEYGDTRLPDEGRRHADERLTDCCPIWIAIQERLANELPSAPTRRHPPVHRRVFWHGFCLGAPLQWTPGEPFAK